MLSAQEQRHVSFREGNRVPGTVGPAPVVSSLRRGVLHPSHGLQERRGRTRDELLLGIWRAQRRPIGVAGSVVPGSTWCNQLGQRARRVEESRCRTNPLRYQWRPDELPRGPAGPIPRGDGSSVLCASARSQCVAGGGTPSGAGGSTPANIVRAESGLGAQGVLAEFASSRWGDRYPAIAADWRIALEQGWALWSMTPTRRQQVLFGDARAFAMNRLLRKALDRHGGFSDGEAAASYARVTLSRALSRLDGSQVVGSAEHNYQRERSSSKIVALGI